MAGRKPANFSNLSTSGLRRRIQSLAAPANTLVIAAVALIVVGPKDLPNPVVHYNRCIRALTTKAESVGRPSSRVPVRAKTV